MPVSKPGFVFNNVMRTVGYCIFRHIKDGKAQFEAQGFGQGSECFTDREGPTVATTTVGRLVNNSEILVLEGKSYRKRKRV